MKRFLLGAAVVAGLAGPLLAAAPAQAWWGPYGGWHSGPVWGGGWHGGWGWRGGWGWGGGVVVAPPVAYAPYPYATRFIPGHYTPWGAWVPPHWGYY